MATDPPIDLKRCIREIQDFPQPGILFRDITPPVHNPEAHRDAEDAVG